MQYSRIFVHSFAHLIVPFVICRHRPLVQSNCRLYPSTFICIDCQPFVHHHGSHDHQFHSLSLSFSLGTAVARAVELHELELDQSRVATLFVDSLFGSSISHSSETHDGMI